MQKVLAFTGKKQSGKSSAAKFIVGNFVIGDKMIEGCEEFWHKENGDIVLDINGSQAILPMLPPNKESIQFYENRLFPRVRVYSFAEDLKIAICRIFGISEELVYGGEKEKNTLTEIRWNQHCKRKLEERTHPLFMTVRELMQEFGNLCRVFKIDCWINATLNKFDSEYCIIDDLRYDNEAEKLKELGAIIIKVEGGIDDSDEGEKGIDKKYVDLVVTRDKEGFDCKNKQILDFLLSKDFFQKGE